MKPKTMHRLTLGIWAAAAAATALREVIPRPLQPALKVAIPAAVTMSIMAGVASILDAQDRNTRRIAESTDHHAEVISGHLVQLVTQVTEISKSDHDRLAYLRGVLARSTDNGRPDGSAPHPAHH